MGRSYALSFDVDLDQDTVSISSHISIYNINKEYNNKLINKDKSNKENNVYYKKKNKNSRKIKSDSTKIDEKTQEKIIKFITKKNSYNYKEGKEEKETTILTIEELRTPKISYDRMQGRPSTIIRIQNREFECLLDTGARINVINKNILKLLEDIEIEYTEETLRCANDSKLEVIGKVTLRVEAGMQANNVSFIVVEHMSPQIIAGIEFQRIFGIKLYWNKKFSNKEAVEENDRHNYICEITAKYGRNTTDEDRFKKTKECLTLKEGSRLHEIISNNKNVFMADHWDIGCTKLVKHKIVTNGNPINIKPWRQPVNLEEKINEAIQNLWQNNIIRKCNSPWNTPLVCIWKKERKDIRLCLDFRQLNLITERQAFPMPNVEEMLDTLHGSKYFTSIDLGNAYYQVELEEESQEKTAFSTKNGQFCFTRMPFGIAAAPGTFQELMTKVLTGMRDKGAMVYLDDILIFSKTIEEHYKTLEEVIQRIGKAGLRINPEKCNILKKEIKFLGHIINEEGIKTDPNKIEAIKKFERPKCIKNLRSFLGICGYYRRFIQDYSKKSRALEELCGKNNNKLIWNETCDKAFLEMKKALTESPILTFPDFKKEFILDTDASFDTIGAVLSQKDEQGNEHVIAYGSHAMNKHEKGYCITRKELLAIYYFCQHFNHYLYGKRFTLRTDHKAITFMLKTKNPITPQFQTWLNYLSSLDINMIFRKGINHGNADMLSRNTCETCSQCLTKHENPSKGKMKTRILTIMTENGGKEWQINNEEIEMIKNGIGKTRNGHYILEEDIVKTKEHKIWIPSIKRKEMIEYTHKLLCHAGTEKVTRYIRNNFDMKDLVKITKEVISKCEVCQKSKVLTSPTKEKPKLLLASEPFEKIYIDICGPWKESIRGEKYIVGIIDQFSRYISLTPISKQNEETIEKVIRDQWVLKYGAPKEIHVDCGKCFESQRIKEMAFRMGTDIIFSSPYHHNTNGLIERQFRTIRDYINATVKDRQHTNWVSILPEIEYTLNATVQKTIDVSPAEVIFGRKINRSRWYANSRVDREVIKQNIEDKQKKETVEITKRKFNIGDKVLVKKEVRNKDQERYDGPYEVIGKNHERSYQLQDKNGTVIRRNVEKIKNFKRGGCEDLLK